MHGHTWHDTEFMLAQLIDDVRRVPVAVFRAAGGKTRDPKPINRPGDKPRLGDRGGRPVEDAIAYLDSLSANKGAS